VQAVACVVAAMLAGAAVAVPPKKVQTYVSRFKKGGPSRLGGYLGLFKKLRVGSHSALSLPPLKKLATLLGKLVKLTSKKAGLCMQSMFSPPRTPVLA